MMTPMPSPAGMLLQVAGAVAGGVVSGSGGGGNPKDLFGGVDYSSAYKPSVTFKSMYGG